MKKWFIGMLALALFALSGSAVMAQGNGHSNGSDSKKQQQACNAAVLKLNVVLSKTYDARTKALLKEMIASFKTKCAATAQPPTVNQDLTKATDDKNALTIQFLGNDNANSVTLPVILPARGKNGSAITWTSSNPNVIGNNGLSVNRPAQNDIAVDLIAVVKFNNAVVSRTFRVIVKGTYPQMSDTERVAKDKAELAIDFGGSDSIGNVTQPLDSLPAKGKNGSSVKWTSSSPSLLSNDGKTINRPANGSGDTIVILTATLQSGSAQDVKIFILTLKQQLPDDQRVAADKAALQIDFAGSDSASRVARPFDSLPSRGVNGSKIVWTSSSPNVLSSDGKTLHRPAHGTGDTFVVMTAILTSGSASDVKTFVLTVKPEYDAAEKVAADKADLAIGFKSGDGAGNVTQALALPTKGYYGSTIVWYSGNAAVVAGNGSIHRPDHGKGDVAVTLTAVISNGGSGDFRTFTVTVKQN